VRSKNEIEEKESATLVGRAPYNDPVVTVELARFKLAEKRKA
jgi:hypothetical protein